MGTLPQDYLPSFLRRDTNVPQDASKLGEYKPQEAGTATIQKEQVKSVKNVRLVNVDVKAQERSLHRVDLSKLPVAVERPHIDWRKYCRVMTPEQVVEEKTVDGKAWWKPGFINVLVGNTSCGKSYLHKQLVKARLASPVWDLRWMLAFSQTASMTDDLNYLEKPFIIPRYNDTTVRNIITETEKLKVEIKEKGLKRELPPGLVYFDDQIGNSDPKENSRAVDMHMGAMKDTLDMIATRGRRMNITWEWSVQYLQFMQSHVRDNMAYLIVCRCKGRSGEYIWEQIKDMNLFANRNEFMQFITGFVYKHQCVIFNMHTDEPVDMFRIVKAHDEEPEFHFHQAVRKQNPGTRAVDATVKAQEADQAAAAKEESHEDEWCRFS